MPNVKIIDASTWAALTEISLTEGEDLATKGLVDGTYRCIRSDVNSASVTQWAGVGVESAGEVGAASVFVTDLVAAGIESASEVGAPTVSAGSSWTPTLVDNQGTAYVNTTSTPSDSAYLSLAFMADFTSTSGTEGGLFTLGRHECSRLNDFLTLTFKSTAITELASDGTGSFISSGTLYQVVVLVKTTGTKYFKCWVNGSLVIDQGDGDVTAGTMDHSRSDNAMMQPDMQRMGALWVDTVTDPDTFSISDFWDSGAGEAKDYTGLGTPDYLMDGNASVWNAGVNQGSISTTFTGTGTFADA